MADLRVRRFRQLRANDKASEEGFADNQKHFLMSESMKKIIEKTIKTTAAFFAVVFLLLCINGCSSAVVPEDKALEAGEVSELQESRKKDSTGRRRRRRAEDYSRLPSNKPANWQIQSVGYWTLKEVEQKFFLQVINQKNNIELLDSCIKQLFVGI